MTSKAEKITKDFFEDYFDNVLEITYEKFKDNFSGKTDEDYLDYLKKQLTNSQKRRKNELSK